MKKRLTLKVPNWVIKYWKKESKKEGKEINRLIIDRVLDHNAKQSSWEKEW